MEIEATCTRCGHKQDLWATILAALTDAASQAAIRSALSLPHELADQAFRYMLLFGNIRQPTYARLLDELTAGVKAGKFSYKKREHQAPIALWSAALADILSSSTVSLPLKANHNYLYAIAVAKLEKHAAAMEARAEEQLWQGVGPRTGAPVTVAEALPDPRQESRKKAAADVAHWERLHNLRPHDEAVLANLATARAKLADLDSARA